MGISFVDLGLILVAVIVIVIAFRVIKRRVGRGNN